MSALITFYLAVMINGAELLCSFSPQHSEKKNPVQISAFYIKWANYKKTLQENKAETFQ